MLKWLFVGRGESAVLRCDVSLERREGTKGAVVCGRENQIMDQADGSCESSVTEG